MNQSEQIPEFIKKLENESPAKKISLSKATMKEINEFVQRVPSQDEKEKNIKHLEKVCDAYEKFIGCSYEEICKEINAGRMKETWPICVWTIRRSLLERLKKGITYER